jgi:hypothetical protein
VRWKSFCKAIASLILGFALGYSASTWGQGLQCHPTAAERDPTTFVDRFARELDLDATGKETVSRIFDEQRAKVEALHQEVSPRFGAIREETRSRVRAVLNAAQQVKFDKIQEEQEARRSATPRARRVM